MSVNARGKNRKPDSRRSRTRFCPLSSTARENGPRGRWRISREQLGVNSSFRRSCADEKAFLCRSMRRAMMTESRVGSPGSAASRPAVARASCPRLELLHFLERMPITKARVSTGFNPAQVGVLVLVKPKTVVRWRRAGFRLYCVGSLTGSQRSTAL